MNKLIDLHTHTDNSEDSLASMESMCLEAINKNISIISFTDHIDYNPADTGY
jgi:histidinol phosphatase-like PHP family hydrolase